MRTWISRAGSPLITGAANGIGRAASLGFARAGARVVLADQDVASGQEVADSILRQGGDARFVAADVTRSQDVRAYVQGALDAYGSIDCFFNNAGIEGQVAPTAEWSCIVTSPACRPWRAVPAGPVIPMFAAGRPVLAADRLRLGGGRLADLVAGEPFQHPHHTGVVPGRAASGNSGVEQFLTRGGVR